MADRDVIRNGLTGKYAYSYHKSKSFDFDSHVHLCYEFLYIMEGDFFYTIEGREYMVSAGDIIVTSPYELHSFSFLENCTYARQFLHIYPAWMKDFPDIFKIIDEHESDSCRCIPAVLVNRYGLDEIFNNIMPYCKDKTDFTDTMVFSYALQLIVKTSLILQNEDLSGTGISANKTTRNIQHYIDKNFTHPISLEEIAHYLFLDKTYLCRIFKQETGMTIKTYLNMRRIVYAKNKILTGEKASNIYGECGFNDYSTFYRAFSKYSSMTPDEFRKSNK